MKIKHKLVLLLGIIIMITIIGISTIIAAIPSEHRKIVIKSARQKNLVQRVIADRRSKKVTCFLSWTALIISTGLRWRRQT
jgi:hypothetical protein